MAFWNNFSFPSPIDDILKRPGFTLSDLLDEDEVVVETRNQKQDLLAVLTTKENIAQLVTYVVSEPEEGASTNVKFRYPVVASEILSSDIGEIDRVLLENEELLDRIFGFFEKEKINLLLSNLVVKVAKSLTVSKVDQIVHYLKRKSHYIQYLINHLEATAVTDFFTRLVTLDVNIDGATTHQWLVDFNFIEKILEKLTKGYRDIHSDVCQSILEIMAVIPWGTPLMNRMVSEEVGRLLLGIVMDKDNASAFKYGMKVFNKILRGLAGAQEENPDSDEEEDKGKLHRPDPLGPLSQLPAPVQLVAEHLTHFCNMLVTPLASVKISDQSRFTYEAFGFDRLMILETIDVLLDLNYLSMNKLLLQSDLFKIGLNLIFEFPHNNFCHRAIENIFVKFLENSGQEAHMTFLEKTKLPEKLIETDKIFSNPPSINKDKPIPLFRPYLHRIVYSIGEIAEAEKAVQLKTALSGVEGWNELLTYVKEERKKLEASSAEAKAVEEETANFQPPTSLDMPDIEPNDPYTDAHDRDDEDLNLDDDQDMDSTNDADDYDADQAEILLTKQEIEASA